MPSFHANPHVISVKAGSTTVCTTTAQYRAVFWDGDNSVALVNTVTNYTKFAGILQNYGGAVGDGVAIVTAGPTKAILGPTASITAGDLVKFDVQTTTCWGTLIPGTIVAGATLTEGASFIVGSCMQGSQAGTLGVFELNLRPFIVPAITTTIAS